MKLHPGYETRPTDPKFVDCAETPLTEEEATYYLKTAWKNVLGIPLSVNSLALLWAQSLGETGRFNIKNNNWGNIKRKGDWKYTSYEAGEVLNGNHEMFYPYHPQTLFAAWDTPLEGAEAYISYLSNRSKYSKDRYIKAWEQVLAGDPVQYCIELKKAGYFTADLDHYTKGVVRLTNEFKGKADDLMAWSPPSPPEDPEPAPEAPEEDDKGGGSSDPKTPSEPASGYWWTPILDILKKLMGR